jgi:hypothetical protein
MLQRSTISRSGVVAIAAIGAIGAIACLAEGPADVATQAVDLQEHEPPAGNTPPPGNDDTCEQQAAWSQCGQPWMVGYCGMSCGCNRAAAWDTDSCPGPIPERARPR